MPEMSKITAEVGVTNRDTAGAIARGAKDVASVLLGIFPVGMAFGIAARQYGFSVVEASLMSLLVFAGASQFIGVALIASGAGLVEVAMTTFFVNLRHVLLSASLSVHLRGTGRAIRSLLAHGITDETFGVSIARYSRGESSPWYMAGVSIPFYLTWNAGTIAGYLAGEVLPDLVRNAMAFALPAVFVSLLVLSCKDRTVILVAAFASVFSMALYLGHVDFGNVVLVAVAGATLGLGVERWRGR
jgi:4-azaleucine resistance transporter AzlC